MSAMNTPRIIVTSQGQNRSLKKSRSLKKTKGISTFRRNLVGLGIVLVGAAYFNVHAARLQKTPSTAPPATARAPQATVAEERALLDQYCVTCHNARLKTAGLMLDTLNIERLGDSAELWEKVAHMLRTGMMPPTGRPRPDTAASTRMAAWLEDGLDRLAALQPNPGRIPPHRLNRTEYANAVRDLLGLEIPAS